MAKEIAELCDELKHDLKAELREMKNTKKDRNKFLERYTGD